MKDSLGRSCLLWPSRTSAVCRPWPNVSCITPNRCSRGFLTRKSKQSREEKYMAIMFNPLFCDVKAHGFPWIKWEEDRPFGKKVFVNCFITEGDNGELLFASNGGLLPDAVYRPR